MSCRCRATRVRAAVPGMPRRSRCSAALARPHLLHIQKCNAHAAGACPVIHRHPLITFFVRPAAQGGRGGGANGAAGMRPGERGQLLELIGNLGKKQLLPVAFFCFSKKR